MSVTVLNWISVQGDKGFAEVELCESKMQLLVHVGDKDVSKKILKENIELDYEDLIEIRKLKRFSDKKTTIKKSGKGYAIWGKVVTVVKLDNSNILIDLYISKGPEFITLDLRSDQNPDVAEGSYVYAVVTNLCCYPTNL